MKTSLNKGLGKGDVKKLLHSHIAINVKNCDGIDLFIMRSISVLDC